MRVEDLRIGNWIQVDDLPAEQVTLETFKTLAENPHHISKFNGLPLTEELPIKLGFSYFGFEQTNQRESRNIYFIGEHQHDGHCIHFVTSNYGSIEEKSIEYYEGLDHITKIDYIHELQNICYDINKKELTLKNE